MELKRAVAEHGFGKVRVVVKLIGVQIAKHVAPPGMNGWRGGSAPLLTGGDLGVRRGCQTINKPLFNASATAWVVFIAASLKRALSI